jgi:NAD(P)-dependent dehydrogenase (short-subunit alcohol dehydrogenase family)
LLEETVVAIDLTGRVALVTGAGRGIGASVARQLAAAGAAVIVNDLGVALDGSVESSEPAKAVVAEIVAAGGRAATDGEDVSDFDAAERMVANAVNTFGRLDIVVNAAGIVRDRMIWNMSPQEWDSVIRVHLYGAFNTSRHAATYWRSLGDSQPGRRIIHFTSASGMFGATGQPNYSAAKLGIVGLMYSTANALERMGATVNALSPAADTRMTPNPADPEDPEAVLRRSPENCATAVAWLASDDAAWCTGQVIGARGYDVTLYSLSRPIARLRSDSPWDAEGLAKAAEAEFGPLVGSIARPTWPPVELLPGEVA